MTEKQAQQESAANPEEWVLWANQTTDWLPDLGEAGFRMGQAIAQGNDVATIFRGGHMIASGLRRPHGGFRYYRPPVRA